MYVTASHSASTHGIIVTHSRRGQEEIERDDVTHNAMADVVQALYSGRKHGRVSPGSAPGIGNGLLTDREAAKRVDLLQRDRKAVDARGKCEAQLHYEQRTDRKETSKRLNLLIDLFTLLLRLMR